MHNIVYAGKEKIPILACPKNCSICKVWHTKHQLWKLSIFCPVHCYKCQYAGYPDEFDIINNKVLVCIKCYDKFYKYLKCYRKHGYIKYYNNCQ